MASYNNYYGNTVYSILGGKVSELIMYIAMSDKCWSKGKYRTVALLWHTGNTAHCTHYGKQSTLFGFELRWLHTINDIKYQYIVTHLLNCAAKILLLIKFCKINL